MTAEPGTPSPSRYPWRVVFVLCGLCGLGLATILPYALTLQGPMLKKLMVEQPLPVPLPVLLSVQLTVWFVIYGVLAALGLWLARQMGMGAPVLEGWLMRGEPLLPRLRAVAPRPAIAGAVGGAIVVLLDWLFFADRTKEALSRQGIDLAEVTPSWWKGLLASFYGGFDEEVLLRLFLLTAVAWIGAKLTRAQGRPGSGVIWVANVLATLIFAMGHLPAAKAMGLPLDAMTWTHVLVLNGVLGIVFGWLYVNAGIEAAMISHYSADIVLHVIPQLFMNG